MTPSPGKPPKIPPKISVIVPVFNVERYVEACINSLKNQSFRDFEAIVVDDGSTDGSVKETTAVIQENPRFHFISQENQGLSGARNRGLDLARGARIAFLDGDDQYDPHFLNKLNKALDRTGANWVACGLKNVFPNGETTTHSAIHMSPNLESHKGLRKWPLYDWEKTIAHFPSAWNKLYDRNLIGDLRFDEGTWFEDHTWFCRLADRSDDILHLPEPLYIQTRGRAGQITGSDTERVFDQFAVLQQVRNVILESPKPSTPAVMGRLAHRLIHERGQQVQDPERRVRFLAAARQWLADNNLSEMPVSIGTPSWSLELSGRRPLSVVLPWTGNEGLLRTSLDSLAHQSLPNFELIIVGRTETLAKSGAEHALDIGLAGARSVVSRAPGPGPMRNAGLDAAKGYLVTFLDAGDRLMPDALSHWTDTLLLRQADFGFSKFRVGLGQGSVHSGLHDKTLLDPLPKKSGPISITPTLATSLHPLPSAKIFRRDFLATHGLRFGSGPLESWAMTIGSALKADRTVYFTWTGAESSETPAGRSVWRAPQTPSSLAHALDALGDMLGSDLPEGWKKRLFGRAIWEKLSFVPMNRVQRATYALQAAAQARRRGLQRQSGPLDPYVSKTIHRILS